jgi:hypothetical protein
MPQKARGRLAVFGALMGCLLLSLPEPWAQPLGLSSPAAPKESSTSTLSSPQGRYVFGQVSESSKDQFMLDTLTGMLWRITESGKIGVHLKAVPYCDEKGDCSPLPPKGSR